MGTFYNQLSLEDRSGETSRMIFAESHKLGSRLRGNDDEVGGNDEEVAGAQRKLIQNKRTCNSKKATTAASSPMLRTSL